MPVFKKNPRRVLSFGSKKGGLPPKGEWGLSGGGLPLTFGNGFRIMPLNFEINLTTVKIDGVKRCE